MFEVMDDDDDEGSDSGSDVGAGGLNLQNLCVPALGYLERCCHILASMWKMPACPVFKGAFRWVGVNGALGRFVKGPLARCGKRVA